MAKAELATNVDPACERLRPVVRPLVHAAPYVGYASRLLDASYGMPWTVVAARPLPAMEYDACSHGVFLTSRGAVQMQHLRLYELAVEESDHRGLAALHAVRKGRK